jgi:hypothetical protein
MNCVRLLPANGTEEEAAAPFRLRRRQWPAGFQNGICVPVALRHTAILSIIRPFFGQNCSAGGWSTGWLRMTLDGKGNANELHT